jgi:hypothetical protein
LQYSVYKKERIVEGLPFLLTSAASFGCQLVYAANLCFNLGMLDSNLGLLLYSQVLVFIFPVLEMHNSWKEVYISQKNFINPELNLKNEISKIKTRNIHNSKKEIHK